MNLYFLVEGTTEREFYPKFMDYYFENKFNRVDNYTGANREKDNYYLISCDGYPYIFTGSQNPENKTTALKSAMEEINAHPVYDYFIICLDADEVTVEERVAELETYIQKYKDQGVELNETCQFILVVQNRCIETWFLGNKNIYSSNSNSEPLISYKRYYNVSKDDPEEMGNFREEYTHQDFHLQYLRALLRDKRMKYRKENLSRTVANSIYLNRIITRFEDTNHLQTFGEFILFCDALKNKGIGK